MIHCILNLAHHHPWLWQPGVCGWGGGRQPARDVMAPCCTIAALALGARAAHDLQGHGLCQLSTRTLKPLTCCNKASINNSKCSAAYVAEATEPSNLGDFPCCCHHHPGATHERGNWAQKHKGSRRAVYDRQHPQKQIPAARPPLQIPPVNSGLAICTVCTA